MSLPGVGKCTKGYYSVVRKTGLSVKCVIFSNALLKIIYHIGKTLKKKKPESTLTGGNSAQIEAYQKLVKGRAGAKKNRNLQIQ